MSPYLALLATLVLAPSLAATVIATPAAPEVLVNTSTSSSQQRADVAIAANGDIFVVWQGRGNEDTSGIYLRRYDAAGTALGLPRLVNTFTAGIQNDVRIVRLTTGEMVAVWVSDDQDGDNEGVYFQRLAANGQNLGAETRVNVTTSEGQAKPAIAALPAGAFVIAFTSSDTNGAGVFIRRFSSTGAALTGEVAVNTTINEQQTSPSISADAQGGFVVAWTSAPGFGSGGNPDGDGAGVYAQRFNSSGAKTGSEFRVNTTIEGDQIQPSVAVRPDGAFLIAWEGAKGFGTAIFAQRYASTGTKTGNELELSSLVTTDHGGVHLSLLGNGYLAVWESLGQDAAGLAAIGRELTADGVPLAGEVILNSFTAASQFEVRATQTAAGGFVAVWTSSQEPTNGNDVYMRRFGSGGCTADGQTLCLAESRFSVNVGWETAPENFGDGQAVPLSTDTGYYWFFNAANVEMVIKVLDACGVNGRFWVFAGGLTNVETDIRVTDTETGASRSYVNPANTAFAPIQDTNAFVCPPSSATASAWTLADFDSLRDSERNALLTLIGHPEASDGPVVSGIERAGAELTTKAVSACTTDEDTLCLNQGRYAIAATWRTQAGATGFGHAVNLTDDTGYMWFFGSANVEMVIKVLDACGLNNSFWVFAGGLTDVETNITVTDTVTGAVRTYVNPSGTQFAPIQDTSAFACS